MQNESVDTTAIGPLPEGSFHLPEGLPGIPGATRYCLRGYPDIEPFYFLVSEESPVKGFLCVDPLWVHKGYFEQLKGLGKSIVSACRRGEARLACLATQREVPFSLTVNLQAPVLFNLSRGEGRQLACLNSSFPAHLDVTREFAGYKTRRRAG